VDAGGHPTGVPKQLTYGSAGEGLCYLSRDGEKFVFRRFRTGHHQLYLKDLKIGKEQEIPWEGRYPVNAVLSPDGAKVVFSNQVGTNGESSGYIYEVPVSGGFPKKIWGDPNTFYGVWDWSPGGSTVLFYSRGAVEEMDMDSGSKTMFLDDLESEVWQAHFSPDGRWVTFNSTTKGRTLSRIYVAPFRKALVRRREWIAITDGGSDDKPHFSSNGKLIFFSSERDGFRCIWAQPLGPDMHPAGLPFAVYHFHERSRALRNMRIAAFDIEVGPNMVLFNQEERTGNIWLLEPAKRDGR
jgi:Tol biopolymer transport system component